MRVLEGAAVLEAVAVQDGVQRIRLAVDEHVQALAHTLKDAELTDRGLPLTDIVWRLFHEEDEVRVTEPTALAKGCRCDLGHIRSVIGRFPAEERAEMADDQGIIGVDCAFCSRIFPVALDSFGQG